MSSLSNFKKMRFLIHICRHFWIISYRFSAFLARSVRSQTQMDPHMLHQIRRIGERFWTIIAFAQPLWNRMFYVVSLHFCNFGSNLKWQNELWRHFVWIYKNEKKIISGPKNVLRIQNVKNFCFTNPNRKTNNWVRHNCAIAKCFC